VCAQMDRAMGMSNVVVSVGEHTMGTRGWTGNVPAGPRVDPREHGSGYLRTRGSELGVPLHPPPPSKSDASAL